MEFGRNLYSKELVLTVIKTTPPSGFEMGQRFKIGPLGLVGSVKEDRVTHLGRANPHKPWINDIIFHPHDMKVNTSQAEIQSRADGYYILETCANGMIKFKVRDPVELREGDIFQVGFLNAFTVASVQLLVS